MIFTTTIVALGIGMGVSMAKPPEPLEEIFPLTALIVDAVVVEVTSEEKADPAAQGSPKQVLALQVNRVIRGKPLSDVEKKALVVTKPQAPYKVRAGIKGAWLLSVDAKTGERVVLGRYGPDSWTFEKIDQKLKELDPPHLR